MRSLERDITSVPMSEYISKFKMIGGPGKAGILVMNNNISKCNKISIINQSPTGVLKMRLIC